MVISLKKAVKIDRKVVINHKKVVINLKKVSKIDRKVPKRAFPPIEAPKTKLNK